MRWPWSLLPLLTLLGFALSSSDVPSHSISGRGVGLAERVQQTPAPSIGDTTQSSDAQHVSNSLQGEKGPTAAASSSRLSVFSGLGLGRLTGHLMGRKMENNSRLSLVHSQNVHLPKVSVEEAPLEGVEEEELLERQRRGRWTFVDEGDPVVSAIRSIRDLFPNVRFKCEPDTTLKLRKTIYPLKTMLTLGADYNTQIGVWQFRSTWEDPLLKGRITIAGRELMLSKSWLIKLMDNEDLATRLKLRVSIDTQDWNAKARFGFRTERLMPLNVRQGFSLLRRVPLDGPQGHAKMEVVTSFALPEPEIELSTRTIGGKRASKDGCHGPLNLGTRGVIAGMGDVHIGIDEVTEEDIEEDIIHQIHCLDTPPKRNSREIPIHTSPTDALSAGKLSTEEESAAEEAKNKLQRMTKILAGNVFWLNCALMMHEDTKQLHALGDDQSSQHVLKLYYLGISLAHVLQKGSGTGLFVSSVLQLFEEWEYHFSSGRNQSIRGMLAKNTEQLFISREPMHLKQELPDEPIIPKLRKFSLIGVLKNIFTDPRSNVVIYECLLTPSVPMELDYCEVMLSLCDIICMTYNKFMDEECYSRIYVFDAVVKVDVKVTHHILNVIAKRLTLLSTNIVHEELRALK